MTPDEAFAPDLAKFTSFPAFPAVDVELISTAFPLERELAARYKPALVPVPGDTLGVRLTRSVLVAGEIVVPVLVQYPKVPELGGVEVKFLLASV